MNQHLNEVNRTLDAALERWQVHDPETLWENGHGPFGWYAVSNDDGIIAYFGREEDAYRFRLAEVNRQLNG